MKRLGLKDIRMYPFAHLICFSDAGLPLADRRALALDETREEIGWLRSRFEERAPEYEKRGFTRADFDRQTALLEMKLAYYESHFEDNDAYEWQGGFNYIVAGIKERNH